MKKSLIISLVAFVLILSGCKPKTSESFDGITINQGTSMKMTEGESQRLSINPNCSETVQPSYTYESDDVSKVMVDEDGVVSAMAATERPVTVTVTGTAAVGNEKVTHTATIQIIVQEFAQGLEFHDLYWMKATEDYQDKEHAIVRLRMHRGFKDSDRHDYQLDTTSAHMIKGDPANPTAVLPQDYDHWVYLNDTVNSMGEKTYYGLFFDSIRSVKSWLLSKSVFFDAEGALQCTGTGAIIEYTDFYMFDAKTSYCLGDREFVDDVTAEDTILRPGLLAQPYPGLVQTGHFDSDLYLTYIVELLNEKSPKYEDFEIWQKYDSKMIPVENYYDEESGETGPGWYKFSTMGYPSQGAFYIGSDDNTGWFAADWYQFKAQTYGNALSTFCLKITDINPETGEVDGGTYYAQPIQLVEPKEVEYSGGEYPKSAPRPTNARRERVELPISTKALNVRMNVTSAMGATFRMAVLNK